MLYKIFYPESNILSQILFLVMRILRGAAAGGAGYMQVV